MGYSLAVNRDWRSRWFASPKELPDFLHSDLKIRKDVKDNFGWRLSPDRDRARWEQYSCDVFTARPGIVIGRKARRSRR